jgi:hypothetical protein
MRCPLIKHIFLMVWWTRKLFVSGIFNSDARLTRIRPLVSQVPDGGRRENPDRNLEDDGKDDLGGGAVVLDHLRVEKVLRCPEKDAIFFSWHMCSSFRSPRPVFNFSPGGEM